MSTNLFLLDETKPVLLLFEKNWFSITTSSMAPLNACRMPCSRNHRVLHATKLHIFILREFQWSVIVKKRENAKRIMVLFCDIEKTVSGCVLDWYVLAT